MFTRISAATIVLLFSSVSVAGELNAKDLVVKADEFRVPNGSVAFNSTVKEYKKNELVRETRYQIFNRGREKSLVQTLFPERQRGHKLLMDNDSLWLFTPNIKRPVRVSMQQKFTGEVSNGDLARTNFAGDYDAKIDGVENIAGQESYRLVLTASRSGVTYPKIIYFVQKKDALPLKASFYAASGKLLKTAEYSEPRTVLGHKCLSKTVFQDKLNPGFKSVLTYYDYHRKNLPEVTFSKEAMND